MSNGGVYTIYLHIIYRYLLFIYLVENAMGNCNIIKLYVAYLDVLHYRLGRT